MNLYENFPTNKYQIIYADPPWKYSDSANAGKRGAVHKYDVLTVEQICKLPVNEISDDNCCLFLWVTFPFIFEAKKVIDAWGFSYKTIAFNWIKTTKNNKIFWGMGNWTRSNSEVCLLAVKGKPKRQSAGVHSVVLSEKRAHSQKPEIIYEKIVELCGNVPRIELFARNYKEEWDSWGNELNEN